MLPFSHEAALKDIYFLSGFNTFGRMMQIIFLVCFDEHTNESAPYSPRYQIIRVVGKFFPA